MAALRSYEVIGRTDLDALDRVAELAATRFEQKMAAVCFVEEAMLWFAGACGLPGRRAQRAGSLCDAALWHDEPFSVEDARADPRFVGHPLVSGPAAVRAYAGAPLLDDEGRRLGTICVFGQEPGAFPAEQMGELTTLSRLTKRLLDTLRPEPVAPTRRVQGWLGVRTIEDAGKPGLIVLSVAAGSPAAHAGLRPTDVLYSIDERVLHRPGDVTAALSYREPGELAKIRYGRFGGCLESFVRIEPRASRALRNRGISARRTGWSARRDPASP